MNNRNRLAPVTLSGKYPVAQLIIDGLFPQATRLDHRRRLLFEYRGLHAVPFTGIDHSAARLCVGLCHVPDLFSVLGNDLNDRNIELLRKFEVTVIVGRHTHDRTGTIVRQHIIRQPDRHFSSVQRVDGIASGKYPGLFLILHPIHIGLHGSVIDVLLHSLLRLLRGQSLCQRMLRCQHHKGRTVQCVRSGGIDGDLLIPAVHRKIHLRTVGLTDPLGLHLLNLLWPVQFIQIL